MRNIPRAPLFTPGERCRAKYPQSALPRTKALRRIWMLCRRSPRVAREDDATPSERCRHVHQPRITAEIRPCPCEYRRTLAQRTFADEIDRPRHLRTKGRALRLCPTASAQEHDTELQRSSLQASDNCRIFLHRPLAPHRTRAQNYDEACPPPEDRSFCARASSCASTHTSSASDWTAIPR